jgi:hypothetical protein
MDMANDIDDPEEDIDNDSFTESSQGNDDVLSASIAPPRK